MTNVSKKPSVQRPASFARGGNEHIAKKQAAGPAAAGRTGKPQNVAPGAKRASGGPPVRGVSAAVPAKPGRTGVVKGK